MIGYIGTYTRNSLSADTPSGRAQGIYVFDFDAVSGAARHLRLTAECVNPEFLAFFPSRKYVYATNELNEFQGEASGAVSAFAVQEDGGLRFINQVSSKGRSPCHICLDADGSFAFISNYMEGNLAVLPIKADGSLGECIQTIQFTGKSVNAERQDAPHAHFCGINGNFILACDLGSDKIWAFSFDKTAEKPLSPLNPPFFPVKPGAGPRHLVFHPFQNRVYLANELDSTVTVFEYREKNLSPLQTLSTLPVDPMPEISSPYLVASNTASAIKLDPSGGFLYVSNRGHNSIAVFQIDKENGLLTPRVFIPTGGETPRDFAVDPSGDFLLVCHQDSDNFTVFRLEKGGNSLKFSKRDEKKLPSGVCVLV
jgi:6-phosphogluconolactonase